MHRPSRRNFLSGLCGCGICLAAPSALAKVLPIQLKPTVTLDYTPGDPDERGLWQLFSQLEENLASSNLRIQDPALNDYLVGVMQRLLGEQASKMRVYPMRNPDFNASMTPNGMMIVNSGLLVRVRNEAQLAAVLGHESGHYLRRHSLQGWRNRRTTSAVMAFVAAGSTVATGAMGTNWYDVANAINSSLLLSVFSYSRELESEADAYGLQLLADAGYPPAAASEIWAQLIEERKASAAVRRKKYQDRSTSSLSTHPPTADRMTNLAQTGAEIERIDLAAAQYDNRHSEWLAAVAPHRAELLEEQVRLNDPGASLYLINSLAKDGWDCTLRYFEGETYRLRDEMGDVEKAADSYKAALQFPDATPDAYRAFGYSQWKNGSREEGRAALRRYLELRPNAADAEMVRFTIGQ